jgi:carbohydrate kinase (thermoresistant glucokinase family)
MNDTGRVITDLRDSRVLVVMGVSGSGKSTVGTTVAAQLGWDFCEGDELHPPANIAAMAAGRPLTDEDRWPWLAAVAAWIDDVLARTDGVDGSVVSRGGVVSCSALKRSYRDVLRRDDVAFVHLIASRDVLAERLAHRSGHFMPPGLLDSQLATLEPLGVDERGVTLDVGTGGESVVAQVMAAVHGD